MGRHVSVSYRVQSAEGPLKSDSPGKTEETGLFLFLKSSQPQLVATLVTTNDCVSFQPTPVVLFLILL